ncbi:APH(3') family aminoglycoside O-phosphotransferase [Arthrobacter sp. RAF14]|uniref:APH(3') family aminoglycoside O-phosphotransferase n=1 Tax=Arthrobacter sp. RAF14 TaxID=3233051 RepID=UPI003F9184C4
MLLSLRRSYSEHDWVPVTVGCSSAWVFKLEGSQGLYVKVARMVSDDLTGYDLIAEGERLAWLARIGFPAPEAVEMGVRDDAAWLVTKALRGRSAAEPWGAGQRLKVVDALADVARSLHAVSVMDCPFDRSLERLLPAAEAAVRSGSFDQARLEPDYNGRTSSQLLAELHSTAPSSEDVVVCHGDLCLPNVVLDPETFAVTGVLDVGRLGRADRYADLALATRSMCSDQNPQYGEVHAERFLSRYGVDQPDDHRLGFYRLLDQFF